MTNILTNRWMVALLVVALTFTAYSFALYGSFKTMDDESSIVNNERIKDFSRIGEIFTTSFFGDKTYYRPLVLVSYMIEYHFFGLNPFYYYLTNILLHIAAAWIVFLIMELLLPGTFWASTTAILFAIHPVHWEAVSNIPGRSILLCAFFYLSAFLFFCRSQKEGKIKFYVFSLICFALALLSKEAAGVLPLALIGYLYFFSKSSPLPNPPHEGGGNFNDSNFPSPGWGGLGRGATLIPFFLILFIYLLIRRALGITEIFYWRSPAQFLLGVLTFLRSVITHGRLFFLPTDLLFDRSTKVFAAFASPELWLTVLFYIVAGAVLYRLRKHLSREILFFICWFWIALLPVSQIFLSLGVQPGYISTADHFLYIPSVGAFAALILGFQKFYEWGIKIKILSPVGLAVGLSGFYAFLLLMTIGHTIYSSNEIAMFERTLQVNPYNTRVRTSLALGYAKLQRFEETEKDFREVLAVDPANVRARIGLGKALCDRGKFWEGLSEYEKIVDPVDQKDLLEKNRSLTYQFLLEKSRRFLDAHPDDPAAYYTLGVVYSKTGETTRGIEYYLKTLELRPDFKNALFNLASSYALLGEMPKAAEYYEKFLILAGDDDELSAQAREYLGRVKK